MIVKPPIKPYLLGLLLLLNSLRSEAQKSDPISIILHSSFTDSQKFNALNHGLYRSLDKTDYTMAYLYNKEEEAIADRKKNKKLKAIVLHNYGMIHYYKAEFAKAIAFYNNEIRLREELKDKKGIVSANNNLGIIYLERNDIAAALRIFSVSLGIGTELKDDEVLSYSYNNIGEAFRILGDYPKALENYFLSLKVEKARKNDEGIAASYNNIALIYSEQGNFESALKNYELSIELKEKLSNLSDLAFGYTNLGTVYMKLNDGKKAEIYFNKAYKVWNTTNDKRGLAIISINLGDMYFKEGNYKEAKQYFEKAIVLNKEVGRKSGEGIALSNMADLLFKTGDVRSSEKYALASLKICEEISDIEGIMSVSGILSNVYEHLKDEKRSYLFLKKHAEASDKMNIEADLLKSIKIELDESAKERMMLVNFEREKVLVKMKDEARRQRTFISGLISAMIAVSVFIIYILISIVRKRKLNERIKEKKRHIDEKQAELMDSINYAKRIQFAMLPREKRIADTMRRLCRSFCILLMFSFCKHSIAQQQYIDSLKIVFLKQQSDTGRLRVLNTISYHSTLSGDLNTGIEYASDAIRMGETDLSLAESQEDLIKARAIRIELAGAFHHLGKAYIFQGKIPEALENFSSSLNLFRRLKDVRGEAICLSEIGNTYSKLPDIEKAIDHLQSSLKLFLSLNDKIDISTAYESLGFAYSMAGKLNVAKEAFEKEKEIDVLEKDRTGEMLSTLDLGKVLFKQGEFRQAKENFLKAEEIAKEIGSEQGLAYTFHDLSLMYDSLSDHENARKYAEMALEKNKLTGDVSDQILCYIQLGISNRHLKNFEAAEQCYLNAFEKSRVSGELYWQMQSSGSLYSFYEERSEWPKASKYFTEYRKLKAELSTKSYNTEAQRKQITADIKKKEIESAKRNEQKDAKLVNERNARRSLIIFSSVLLFILFIFIAYAIYNNVMRQKANVLLEEQTRLVEKKQEEILDSIRYAKRIQSSLLTPVKYIEKHLSKVY